MRKPIELLAVEQIRANLARPQVSAAIGKPVTLDYVKQDGTDRTLVGTVVEVKGLDDKEVVVIETAEGFRSANMWGIRKVTL